MFGIVTPLGVDHTYVQYATCDSCKGWGFSGGKKGGLPEPEKHFNPSECNPCTRTMGLLQHGIGTGKSGVDASDAEVMDCIAHTPFSSDYTKPLPFDGKSGYVCYDWAKEAVAKCGLSCP